jgi:hypothetical protein
VALIDGNGLPHIVPLLQLSRKRQRATVNATHSTRQHAQLHAGTSLARFHCTSHTQAAGCELLLLLLLRDS